MVTLKTYVGPRSHGCERSGPGVTPLRGNLSDSRVLLCV